MATRILFVCSRNQWRSPTAERVWAREPGIEVRSAGTSAKARRSLTEADLRWGDIVFVMESRHAEIIRAEFGRPTVPMVVLDIPDEYRFMDPELVEMLRVAVAPHLKLPWSSDQPLDTERAARILSSVDARFADVSLAKLAGGWDFDTFLVDDSWIFRFPKRPEVGDALRAEWRVLDALAGVELPYEVPNHLFRVEPTLEYDRPFCGYPLCEGTPVTETGERLTTGLDTFLESLDRFAGLQVEVPEEGSQGHDDWARESHRRIQSLRTALGDALADATANLLASTPPATTERVLLHNDLGPEHILVVDRRVTAVIDWADAAYGDPAADVAGAVLVWGYDAVRAALRRDDGFWDRVRRRVALASVSSIWFGECEGRPDYTRDGVTALESVV